MNYVFLDIDGVLNNLGTVAAFGGSCDHFDPVSIALIARLCQNGSACIVISSSWRYGDTNELRERLSRLAGPALVKYIVDETPVNGESRGHEIQQWLGENLQTDRYVIIDDDDDMLPHQPFVKTTFEDGFRFRHYVKALGFLNPNHKDFDLKDYGWTQDAPTSPGWYWWCDGLDCPPDFEPKYVYRSPQGLMTENEDSPNGVSPPAEIGGHWSRHRLQEPDAMQKPEKRGGG